MAWLLTLTSLISSSSSPTPAYKQTAPHPQLQTTPLKISSSSQHKSSFFNFCSYSVRVLIYCGFFFLVSKSIFFFNFNIKMSTILLLNIFLVYVFCLDVYLLYCFFSTRLIVWIYNFVLVMICFRFCKIIFVCKLLKLMSNYRLRCVVMK
jgi:hypothetical protein